MIWTIIQIGLQDTANDFDGGVCITKLLIETRYRNWRIDYYPSHSALSDIVVPIYSANPLFPDTRRINNPASLLIWLDNLPPTNNFI